MDVTEKVNEDVKKGKVTEAETFGSKYLKELAEKELKKSDLKKAPGITAQALPFYEGNRFYLFYIKTYKDVRMVAAPPSSIGKFGGETDNWMWPRHTCDFSIFRIYADKDGNPAEYSKDNVPLKSKKYLTISLKGLQEAIMHDHGFPGSTSRYLTESEVRLRMELPTYRASRFVKHARTYCARKWLPATRYVSNMPASLPDQATTGKTPSV